jgi:hypothetical protein
MRMVPFLSVAVVACFCVNDGTAETTDQSQADAPKVFGLNAQWLAQAKAHLAAGDASLQPALEKLLQDAEEAVILGPFTVIDKTSTPPSGDKNDYMSIGPYWWPDPDKDDGLPYIRRDGDVNPEFTSDANDSSRLFAMIEAVDTLALAYYFTGEERWAERAALLLRTWFVAPETRMNPHLEFGQAIPGRVQGRCYGIIETRRLPKVIDAVGLLAASPAWTEKDDTAIRQWFRAYLGWLRTSRLGQEEGRTRNNHGTWYDVQVAHFALFVGEREVAREVLKAAKAARIDSQVEPDGKQPHELQRTLSFNYSVMNLAGMFALARLGEHVGVDLWKHPKPDESRIRAALDFLAGYATEERSWPHPQIREVNRMGLLPLLLHGAIAYDAPVFRALIGHLPSKEVRSDRNRLLYPEGGAPVEAPQVFVLNAHWLAQVKAHLESGDESLQPALEQLLKDAEEAVTQGPFSVVDKTSTPPSGDKHDYISFGTYWWPDPDKEDGLPYIQRDGKANPEFRSEASDSPRMAAMSSAVDTLALAYYFTGDERWAERAALLLRTWFVAPETRMNPHLEYGQAIPGRVEGRSTGIIDTRRLTGIPDAVSLLSNSPAWTQEDGTAIRQWFRSYLDWLRVSGHGRQVRRASNNIGTWYDVQVVSFALFVDDRELAKEVLESAKTERLKAQIEPDGTQPHELRRTLSFNYSAMNLQGMFALARLGEHVRVDLWNYPQPGESRIRAALDYLAGYATEERDWPHPQISGVNRTHLLPLLLHGAIVYEAQEYRALIPHLPPRPVRLDRRRLLYPLEDAAQDQHAEAHQPENRR